MIDYCLLLILPELYEENNEVPNVYSNLLNNNNESKNKDYRLKRKSNNVSKSQLLTSNFRF